MSTSVEMHKSMIRRLKKNPEAIREELTASDVDLMHMALGMAGETGECVDLVKKSVINGHPVDRIKMGLELGDVMFYVHGMAMILGLNLEEILRANNMKLNKRYPEGYSDTASIKREDVA